jgi:hypothetical protein
MGSYLDKLLRGIKQVYRNGTPMPLQPVINLIGFANVLDNPSLGSTDVYASTGGSGGGGLIIQSNGSAMPVQPALNFSTDFTLTNDVPGQSSDVALTYPARATLSANFTQPAVLATVAATVSSSSSFQVGATVFLFGGGFYSITAIPNPTHLTLRNTGAVGNAAPAATVTSGVLVIPSGPANLLFQANGTPVTERQILNLIGLTYEDVGGTMQFTASTGDTIGTEVTVASGSSATLAQHAYQTLIIDTTGARPIRVFPSAPNDHDIIRAKFIGSSNNLGAEFQPNSGQTIEDPDAAGTFSAVRGVSFNIGGGLGWFYQAAGTRWCVFT